MGDQEKEVTYHRAIGFATRQLQSSGLSLKFKATFRDKKSVISIRVKEHGAIGPHSCHKRVRTEAFYGGTTEANISEKDSPEWSL